MSSVNLSGTADGRLSTTWCWAGTVKSNSIVINCSNWNAIPSATSCKMIWSLDGAATGPCSELSGCFSKEMASKGADGIFAIRFEIDRWISSLLRAVRLGRGHTDLHPVRKVWQESGSGSPTHWFFPTRRIRVVQVNIVEICQEKLRLWWSCLTDKRKLCCFFVVSSGSGLGRRTIERTLVLSFVGRSARSNASGR